MDTSKVRGVRRDPRWQDSCGGSPPEFRREIVGLLRSGRSPEALAWKFEPSASAIRKWVNQADLPEGHRNDELTTFERQELRQARREIKHLRIYPG